MTKKRFTYIFTTLTRLIFTVITGEALVFLAAALTPAHDFASAMMRANLPLCTEHLIAGIILYLVMAFSASVMLRNT